MNTSLTFDDFLIEQMDERNWTLQRQTDTPSKNRKGELTGSNVLTFIGYYDTLAAALKSAIQHGLQGAGKTDAVRILRRIDELSALIEAKLPEPVVATPETALVEPVRQIIRRSPRRRATA